MRTLLSWIKIVIWTLLVGGMGVIPARAAWDAGDLPPGFRQIESMTGVRLYRKDYANGNPDFVQVVDLSAGARVKLLHGPIREERPEKGAYGGSDPRILSRSLQQYWEASREEDASTFCVTNGQFFYMPESPTRLPLPLKVDGELISDGYAKNEFADQKLMLEIWTGQADIRPLSREALYTSTAPDIVAGLAEDARKSPTKYVARTFVGVMDGDGDGQFEMIMIFNSRTARQKDAAQVLRSFGAAKVMMLDGGGSTQLACLGKDIITSERLIPQALAVLAGNPLYKEDRQMRMVDATPNQPLASVQPEAAQPATILQPAGETQASLGEVLLAAAAPEMGAQAAAALPAPGYRGAAPQVVLFKPTDLLWIPGVIGPTAVFLFIVLLRWRSTY